MHIVRIQCVYMYMYGYVHGLLTYHQYQTNQVHLHVQKIMTNYKKAYMFRVYFRILLKRGQTHSSKFQEGQIQIQGRGQSHIQYRETNCQGGSQKYPLRPPPPPSK